MNIPKCRVELELAAVCSQCDEQEAKAGDTALDRAGRVDEGFPNAWSGKGDVVPH